MAASYRLTRLVTADVITAPARDRLVRFAYEWNPDPDHPMRPQRGETWSDVAMGDPDAPWLAKLITCRWCAGVWIAAAVTIMRRRAPAQWGPIADAATCAAAAALLASFED